MRSCVHFRPSFGPKIFENFRGRSQKFSSEIAQVFDKISAAGRRLASAGPLKVPASSAARWRDVACAVARIFKRISDRKFSNFFRCRKNFHPKSCEIAQKSARPDDARPQRHSDRSSQGRLSTDTTRPAEFVAVVNEFWTEIFRIFFGAAKIFI